MLFLMNVMHGFICTFRRAVRNGKGAKISNENICIKPVLIQKSFAPFDYKFKKGKHIISYMYIFTYIDHISRLRNIYKYVQYTDKRIQLIKD